MRYKLEFELENEEIPIQYRKSILSFIKLSLSENNQEYYEKYYKNKDCIIKPYTFGTIFQSPQFKKDTINLKNKKFDLIISIADYNTAIIFYNAFNKQKNQKFSLNKNSMKLKNIELILEKKVQEENIIKFISPLVVRERENRKDFYHSYESEKFMQILKTNIKEQLKITNINPAKADTIKLEAVKAKKAIIQFYEKKIETSLGTFKIKGDKELIEYLYKSGMGSKHSSGFGMFEII